MKKKNNPNNNSKYLSVPYYHSTCAKLGEKSKNLFGFGLIFSWLFQRKPSVFPFCRLLRFTVFPFFGIWFSVFSNKTSGFSDLVSDVVFGFLFMLFGFRFLRLPSTCHDMIERNARQTWMTSLGGSASRIELYLGPWPYKESQRAPGQKMAENESHEAIVDCIAFLWRG